MNIELRKLKINLSFSHETVCFTADIYVNGVKAGEAENDGRGGNTSIGFNNKSIEKAASNYCKSLPPVKSQYFPEGLPMDLEMFIDGLVQIEDRKKQDEQNNKKIAKNMLKGIVYGVKGNERYAIYSWGKLTLVEVANNLVLREKLKLALQKIKNELKKGETIFNLDYVNSLIK